MHELSWPLIQAVCRECGFIPRLHWSQFSPQQADRIKTCNVWEELDHAPGHTLIGNNAWSPNLNSSSRQWLFLQSAQPQTFSPKSYNLLSLFTLFTLLPMQTKQASNLHLRTTKAFTIRATPSFDGTCKNWMLKYRKAHYTIAKHDRLILHPIHLAIYRQK